MPHLSWEQWLQDESGRRGDRGPRADRREDGRVVLSELWREMSEGRVSGVALAAASCDVVIAQRGGRVTAFDILGVRRWQFDCGADDPRVAIAAEGRRTAVLADGSLWWLNHLGEVVWRKTDLLGLRAVAVDAWARRIVCAGDWQHGLILAPSGRELGRLDLTLVASLLALAPLSDQCFAASDFGDLAAFDETGSRLWQRRMAMPVTALAVDQSGELVLLASPQDRVYAFGVQGETLGSYAVGQRPTAVACDWNGAALFFANGERQLLMMGRQGGLRFLQHTREAVELLATDRGGRRLLTVGRSGEVVLYEVARASADGSSFIELHSEAVGRAAPSVALSASWEREVYPLTELLTFGRLLVSGAGDLLAFIDAHQHLIVFDRRGTQVANVRLRGAFPDLRRATEVEVLLAYTDRMMVLVRGDDPHPTTISPGAAGLAEARISEDGSLVLGASEFGDVVLFGAEGSQYWRSDLGTRPDALVVSRRQELAAAVGGDGSLVAWDLSGAELWRRPTGAGDVLDLLMVGGDVVLVLRSGGVAAVSPAGEVRWRKKLAPGCLRTYALGEYLMVEQSGGVLVEVAAGGEVVERRRASSRDALLTLAQDGQVLLLDVVEEQVRCINRAGEVLWKYDPTDHVSYLSADLSGDTVAVVAGRTLALVESGRGRSTRSDWTEYLEL